MNTLQSIWNGLDWSYLLNIVLSVVPSLLCITFHEVSHGYVAYRLGDTTAKDAGRLTLNPLKHIDPMGLLMMVVFKFGWAKPVPVNMMRFRSPKRGMALTALAGPVSNLLMAVAAVAIFRVCCLWITDIDVLSYLWLVLIGVVAQVNIGLAVFNLLPIPPLDGSRIFGLFLPERWTYTLERYSQQITLVLMVLLFLGVLRTPLDIVENAVCDLIGRLFGFADLFNGYL